VRDGGARDTSWGCGASDDADVEVKGRSTSMYRSLNSSSSSIREREEREREGVRLLEREPEGLFWQDKQIPYSYGK
jgi:hypothetical protein